MNQPQPTAATQAALWNGRAGRAWVDEQAVLEQMFKPFEVLLQEGVRTAGARQVLDVGCGTGSTTLAVARLPGPGGTALHCTGADISQPMITAAQARAAREGLPVDFICADVQDHAFAPARFDMIISRFGVMFFDHPVAAFANLRRAAQGDARLLLFAWRSAADNPFMTTAERAAAPLLPKLPARRPGAPGQFGFADPDRVAAILRDSGWADIDIQPVDAHCSLPEPALAGYFSRLGPVGVMLQEVDERTRAQVVDTVRTAFEPYVEGTQVRFTAACWRISARAPSAAPSTAP